MNRCDYLEGRYSHCKEVVLWYICIFLVNDENRYLAVCERHMHALKSCMLHKVISRNDYTIGKIMES